jgi:hypothetical protein
MGEGGGKDRYLTIVKVTRHQYAIYSLNLLKIEPSTNRSSWIIHHVPYLLYWRNSIKVVHLYPHLLHDISYFIRKYALSV